MAHIPTSLLSDMAALDRNEKSEKSRRAEAQKLSTRPKLSPGGVSTSLEDLSKLSLPTPGNLAPTPIHLRPQIRTPLSSVPENAYNYPTTARRIAHLVKRDSQIGEELAFVYESKEAEGNNSGTVGDALAAAQTVAAASRAGKGKSVSQAQGGLSALKKEDEKMHRPSMAARKPVTFQTPEVTKGEGLRAEDLNIVAPVARLKTQTTEVIERTKEPERCPPSDTFPLLRPTTRKEVAVLKQTMIAMLRELGTDEDQEYPTEMHAFLSVIQDEQKIYDSVFQEVVRQVTVNMVERGEVLAEIRNRYATMFAKIPRHVRHLHTELVAQRRLNRRLSEELVRAKDIAGELYQELDMVRQHDVDITRHARETQEKLLSVLTQSDNTDEILAEFHRLYRMQRNRLEEAVRQSELEKRIWIDAATNLALRIGQDQGINDLVQLQKLEHSRLRSANHIIVIIGNTNEAELTAIERKIEGWRVRLVRLSQSVVDEDKQNMEILGKMQREMALVLRNLDVNEPREMAETEHALLKLFHVFDVHSLSKHLLRWVEQTTAVAIRFTSDRDLTFQEELGGIRKMSDTWIEASLKLLRRNEKNINGQDYVPLIDLLSKIGVAVEDWLGKLETRVSGEDGIASNVISLQNQLEDRYTTYSARDADKPLPPSERTHLKESLTHWINQIEIVMNTLSNTTEMEQNKVPMQVDNWVSRLVDQLNTDTDIRNEENLKLHTAMISWMVQLLVKGSKESPTELWDHEFHQLHQELISNNMNLTRDASEMEVISDDGKDLREVVRTHCDNWLQVAKRLLNTEKRNAGKVQGARDIYPEKETKPADD